MSKKIILCNGETVTIYGNHSKEEIEKIRKIRNNQIREAQSRADISRDKILKCKYCGGNGCTICGW